MKFGTFQFMVAVIITVILMIISDRWHIEWYKIGVIYFLGIIAMLLVMAQPKPRRKTEEILSDIVQEINDAIDSQPTSAADVLDYLKRCKDYCKTNNI
jgi:hypothetical protein